MRLIVESQFKKRWTRKKMEKPGKYGRPIRSSRRRKRASGKKLKLDDSTGTSDVNDCNVIVNIQLLKNLP